MSAARGFNRGDGQRIRGVEETCIHAFAAVTKGQRNFRASHRNGPGPAIKKTPGLIDQTLPRRRRLTGFYQPDSLHDLLLSRLVQQDATNASPRQMALIA